MRLPRLKTILQAPETTPNSGLGLIKDKKVALQFIALSLICILSLFVLQSRIGIRDVDAFAYIVGAYSIQAGNGYEALDGSSLVHWPPGYSFVLSFFQNPIQIATIVNYWSFGLAIGLIYLLAIKRNWPWQAALGVSLAMGFGFFRDLATNAKPDILTYALFLLAVLLYQTSNRIFYLLSFVIWTLLIPFKLIAIVFTPAAILVDWFITDWPVRGLPLQKLLLLIGWCLVVISVLVFNYLMDGSFLSSSHESPTLNSVIESVLHFLTSIPRSFLSHWYGSILSPQVFAAFSVLLVIGLGCLTTLRPSEEGARYRNLGLMVLVFSFLLVVVRQFDTNVRLTGYGVLLIFLSFRPVTGQISKGLWLLYAAAAVMLGTVNSFTTNALGVNDPRYERLAQELSSLDLPPTLIFTNSFHILDIHVRHPSVFEIDIDQLEVGTYFLWVYLPQYDTIATSVIPVEPPGKKWCPVLSVNGAELFYKCLQ